jgi:hypothetical protein
MPSMGGGMDGMPGTKKEGDKKKDAKKKEKKDGGKKKPEVKDDYVKNGGMPSSLSYSGVSKATGKKDDKIKKRNPDGTEKKPKEGEKEDDLTLKAFEPINGYTRTVSTAVAGKLVGKF